VQALRALVQAEADEGLMVIYNEIFLGLIRERAQIAPVAIRRSALRNLLRQAVVTACTAMETFLPLLLQTELQAVIQGRGGILYHATEKWLTSSRTSRSA
jgi:hypothetical protein